MRGEEGLREGEREGEGPTFRIACPLSSRYNNLRERGDRDRQTERHRETFPIASFLSSIESNHRETDRQVDRQT